MEQEKLVATTTVILALAAGFCDAATFVAANEVFSAHVTGNFILFAYDIVHHADRNTWVKLLTFPVFVIAIILGGLLARRSSRKYLLLIIEGGLLLLIGLAAFFHRRPAENMDTQDVIENILVFGIVFAMGLQNCFGKLFAKTTYGPTTIMTGNVTQASLDLGTALGQWFKDATIISALAKDGTGIGSFLIGCVLGALTADKFGLQTIALPGAAILLFCLFLSRRVRQDEHQ